MAVSNTNTCLDEEKLQNLIRDVFKEEFTKQEQNITKIISANFQMTMTEIMKVQNELR